MDWFSSVDAKSKMYPGETKITPLFLKQTRFSTLYIIHASEHQVYTASFLQWVGNRESLLFRVHKVLLLINAQAANGIKNAHDILQGYRGQMTKHFARSPECDDKKKKKAIYVVHVVRGTSN